MDNNYCADEDKKDLLKFLADIKCLDPIRTRADKFNVFDVFGFARNEIRHSFFLKWLLDPKENHSLGDQFIKTLLSCLVSSEPDRYGESAIPLLMMDCSDFIVQRETHDIDLFLLSESNSVAIIIENKIGSHEHPSKGFDTQLEKYEDFVEREFSNIKTKIYVYLSPQGEIPSKLKWQALSYLTVVEAIEKILEDNRDRLSLEVEMFIQNYIDVIRRDIVEDEELNRLCNEIYNTHRKALDLLYNHSNMGKNPTQIAIKEALSELSSEGRIIYDQKVHDTFYTPGMTNYLPDLRESMSYWNNSHLYRYWIERDDKNNKIKLVFDISNVGTDENSEKKLNAFFGTRSSSKTKKTDTYNRIHTISKKDNDLSRIDNEEEKKEKVKELVLELLDKKEKEWIKACDDYIAKNSK